MFDLLVKNGTVVTPQRVAEMDIGVVGERVAVLGEPGTLGSEAKRMLDAKGRVVVPGGIETHCHVATPIPTLWTGGREGVSTQPVDAGTRAAVFGGTTTVLDFTVPEPGKLPIQTVEERMKVFAGQAYADYAFHCVLAGDIPQEAFRQIKEVIESGTPTFKIFTTFSRVDPPSTVKDGHLFQALGEIGKHGGMAVIHAEDDEMVEHALNTMTAEGRTEGHLIHLVHSNVSEDIAFRKVIRLAEHAGSPLYFVHVTAKEGVRAIAEAKARGQAVYGEGLHNYMVFTSEDYKKPNGPMYHTYPALKFADDREALANGAIDGSLSTVATDDYTTHKDIKMSGNTIETVCGGHNGIQTRMMVAYTELVAKRGASLQRFAEVTSTNAARIHGLYPRKGVIAPGSDADLAILDVDTKRTIRLSDLKADSDYSIWEGREVQGWPTATVLRGNVVVENGKLTDTKGGRFLKRKVAAEVRKKPVC